MADPDLKIKGRERGDGYSDPGIRGRAVSEKFFGLKIWGGGGGTGSPGSSPGSATDIYSTSRQLRAIFHAIKKDKSKPLACTSDMMNNEVKARIYNQ